MDDTIYRPHVWVLDADISAPDTDDTMSWQDGIVTVHATLDGAVTRLEKFLHANGIDVAAARWGETRTATSLCNDVDPDTLDGGEEINWGINRQEVQA